jgi:uncharacterized protein
MTTGSASQSWSGSSGPEPSPERVTFRVGTERCVGHVYAPSTSSTTLPGPAVVIGGSLTSVKEMMGAAYARAMAGRGFVALSIDYRHYGESGGTPRQFEDQESKAADVSAAVDYLSSRPDVDPAAVFGLGVCTSGATMLYAANVEPRLRAVASVAGHLADPQAALELYGGTDGVGERRRHARAARERWEKEGVTELIQAYSDVNLTAAHPGPMEYYMDQSRGGGVPQWLNAFAVMAWAPWLELDAVAQAEKCTTPTILVHTDNCAMPGQARRVHEALRGPKHLFWTTGDHFDFYDDPAHVSEATDAVVGFFREQGALAA